MRIHVLQHVPFEDEAGIGVWARKNLHTLTKTALYQNEALPPSDKFDCLVVMGGPMSIHDEKEFPWLVDEKTLIKEAVRRDKRVLGVCLGAQLIANVLGSRVYKNPHKEIGWFDIDLTAEAASSAVFGKWPKKLTAFHWHGETFDLPSECRRIASSRACLNQAFETKGRVIGLQFHLESTEESIHRLIQNCPEDLAPGEYVQSAEELAGNAKRLSGAQHLMEQLLDRLIL